MKKHVEKLKEVLGNMLKNVGDGLKKFQTIFHNFTKTVTPLKFLTGLLVLVVIVIIISVVNITNSIVSSRESIEIKTRDEMIAERDKTIEAYKEQYEEIIKIRDLYRTHLKELVELLYNKQTYLNLELPVDEIEKTDELLLLQLRNISFSMEDDLKVLGEVKEYIETCLDFSDSFPFTWPIKDKAHVVISNFGYRELVKSSEEPKFHTGIDILGSGGESVIATANGVVSAVYDNHMFYGKLVVIEHKHGFETFYAHLEKTIVKEGDKINRGDIIGQMGNTGLTLGIRLYYEIRKDGTPLDPMIFLSLAKKENVSLHVGGPILDVEVSHEVTLIQIRDAINSLKDDYNYLEKIRVYLEARKELSDTLPFAWPTDKEVTYISSEFGFRENSEIGRHDEAIHFHAGIDLTGKFGLDITATANGTVTYVSKTHPVFGWVVLIQHEYGFETVYAHLSKILVKKGDVVVKGQVVGKMGNTGFSKGVHLHYEIRKDDTPINPLIFLNTNF